MAKIYLDVVSVLFFFPINVPMVLILDKGHIKINGSYRIRNIRFETPLELIKRLI